jgi:hypothetical protein
MTPNAVKQSKVYSIIPTNGDGDLTFTRGTNASATLSGANGLIETVPYNLILFSQLFSNANWLKNSTVVLSENNTAPNGTLTATRLTADATNPTLQQVITGTIGLQYTTSFWARRVSGTAQIYLRCGDTNPVSNIAVTSNWQLFSFTGIPTTTTVRCGIGFVSPVLNTDVIEIWGAQLVQGSVPKDYFFTTDRLNVPRLNYDVSGGCPSLLLEPQRTNLVINSVWAGGAVPTGWSQFTTGGTLTPTTSIKNPNVTALNFNGTASRNFISQTQAFTNGFIYAISFYVESVTTPAFLDTIIGTSVVTGNSTYLKNNISVNGATEAIVAGNTYTLIYAATSTSIVSTVRIGLGTSGNSTANFTISMPQMEIGVSNTASYSTSFIPTTTGSVTRNADVFSRNNIYTNNLITSAGGTWFFELNNNLSLIRDASFSSLYIDTSSSGLTNGFSIKHTTGGSTLRLQIVKYISGASSLFYQTLTNTVKIAIKWNGVTANIFVNGVKVVAATAFTTTNMEFLGCNGGDVPKYIKSMLLFPTPLTDTECINLTTL